MMPPFARGVLSSFALIALLTAPGLASQRAQNLTADEIETLRLDEDGRALIRVQVDHASLPAFDLFSGPAELSDLTMALADSEPGDKRAGPLILLPGRHEIILTAPEGYESGATEIQGRLRLDPPLDAFEPNDTVAQATPIDLPFHQIVRLSGEDRDWFRVEPGRGGIIGIHLHYWGGGYLGPQIQVVNAAGDQLLATEINIYSWRGMRYVRAEGEPLFIGVNDSYDWAPNQADGFKMLEIVHYRPTGAANGTLITLGLGETDTSFFQLDLVGAATGTPVRTADEAAAVATELARAVSGRSFGVWPSWVTFLIILVVGAGGYYGYRRWIPPGTVTSVDPGPDIQSATKIKSEAKPKAKAPD
jgi:hypothetical protein